MVNNRTTKEVSGVIVIATALFLFLCFYGFWVNPDVVISITAGSEQEKTDFVAGPAGIFILRILAEFIGSSSFFLALYIALMGWFLIRDKSGEMYIATTVAVVILIPSFSTFLHLLFGNLDPFFGESYLAGGLVGYSISTQFLAYFGKFGSYLILFTLIFVAFLLLSRLSLSDSLEMAKGAGSASLHKLKLAALEKKRLMQEKREEERRKEKVRTIARTPRENLIVKKGEKRKGDSEKEGEKEKKKGLLSTLKIGRRKEKKKVEAVQNQFEFVQELGEYTLPSLNLLEDAVAPPVDQEQQKKLLMHNAALLEKKLLDFQIEGKVTQIMPGPVVTMYEFEPAPGVKVSRIVSLSDDLALGMRAMSIRILAPVPGKSVIGIEIPNDIREPIMLKEIIGDEIFQQMDSRLSVSLGKDIYGNPMAWDLASIPHLLIAGTTGSGKSVGLNGMITSILYKARPDEVKFLMIDPKMIELSVYDGIPHLLTPVVTNPKKAAGVLRWAVMEMERRYQLLSDTGVRHISTYNDQVEKELKSLLKRKKKNTPLSVEHLEEELKEGEKEGTKALPEKLPFIVIVIDELADLMVVAGKEVEVSLMRLAQKARAAGMHLLIATQRPSVDVLTGVIKSNFPSRLSFKVFSRTDSRTVLDAMGAEKLLGKGDALFLAPGSSEITRVHGGYISEEEISKIVNYIKSQQKPQYNDAVMEFAEKSKEDGSDGNSSDGGGDDERDEKYEEAIEFVASSGQASISMIQRRLRVGYNRAARMIELMEKDGIVGPSDGVRPREVLVRNDLD